MHRQKQIMLAIVLIVFLAVAAGCQKQPPVISEPDDEDIQPVAVEEDVEQFLCPLDGAAVADPKLVRRRPLVVIIGNIPGLAEVSGVDKACLVYEMLAEGGITRLMPVFLHQDAEVVGSVRSARHYFLDKALEFNAAFGHCGYSPEAKQDISKLKVIALNEFFLPQVYWRVRTKKEPHNVYTSTERLYAELDRRGLMEAPSPVQFDFYDGDSSPLGAAAQKVTLRFSPNYVVDYVWDETIQGYARIVNGKAQLDEESKQPLVAKNVLVQLVEGTRVLDSEGRLDMKLVGQGSGRIFQQGVSYELKWSKSSRTQPTNWTDKAGEDIRLVKGQTWIEILPQETQIIWE
ncbi:MAG: DUF3048 domain-containing protein [bacterium]